MPKDDHPLENEPQIIERCERNITEFFFDPDRVNHFTDVVEPLSGGSIIQTEMNDAVTKTKLNKAANPDNISEVYLLFTIDVELWHEFLNQIYTHNITPSSSKQWRFVVLLNILSAKNVKTIEQSVWFFTTSKGSQNHPGNSPNRNANKSCRYTVRLPSCKRH